MNSHDENESVNRLTYLVDVGDVEVMLSWEHEAYSWLTVEELKSLDIRPTYRKILDYLINNKIIV
ncbi:hypothetical protein EOL96_07650 [Candidatus Saccharibacteria bacterium]|nr:hypothetical protein [Candidatus Saccharibacteria bacterium]